METTTVGFGPVRPSTLRSLGRYCDLEKIGEGGQGVVFRAYDPALARRVAIKTLSQSSPTARARFLREARALARLDHPSVVRVYEVDSIGDLDYLVMEYLDGETLRSWLARGPSRAARERTILALAAGLAAVHRAGMVHRDVKPDNVICTPDGRFVLVDFGLARDAEDEDPGASGVVTVGTQVGDVMGTPAYMAPEQLAGSAVGPPADQFALCVSAWEILTGARPFSGESIEQRRTEVASMPSGPRWISGTLRRGLLPDPAARWPSVDVLAARLRRSLRLRFALPATALALALVAILVVIIARSQPDPPAACTELDRDLATAARTLATRPEAHLAQMAHADLSRLQTEYSAAVARACSRTNDPVQNVRLTCLAAGIDEFAAGVSLIGEPLTNPLLLSNGVPEPSACEGPSPPRRVRMARDWYAKMLLKMDGRDVPGLVPNDPDPCRTAYWIDGDATTPAVSVEEQRLRAALRCGDDYRIVEATSGLAIADYDSGNQDQEFYQARARALDARSRLPIAYQTPAFTVFRARDAWDDRDYGAACTLALAAVDEMIEVRSWGMVETVVAAVGKFCATTDADAARGLKVLATGLDRTSDLAGAARAWSPDIVWRRLGYLAWIVDDRQILATTNARLVESAANVERPIELRVLDTGGRAVSGAVVTLVASGNFVSDLVPVPIHESLSVTTDEAGIARVADLPDWYVYAHAGELASAPRRLGSSRTDLVVGASQVLRGRVEGATTGVTPVIVAHPATDDVMTVLDGPVAVATARADNTFALRVPAGTYRVLVRLGTRMGPMMIARDSPLVLRTPKGRRHRVVVHNDLSDVSAFDLWIAEGAVSGGTGDAIAKDAVRKGIGFRYAATYPDPDGRTGHFDHAWDIDIPDDGTLCYTAVRDSDEWREIIARDAVCTSGPFSDPIVIEARR